MDAPLSTTPAKEEAKTVSDMKEQPRKVSEVVFDVSQGISNAI